MVNRRRRPQPELRDRLGAFNVDALKSIARTLAVKPRSESRAAYLDVVAAVLGTPDHLAALDRVLTASDWDLLDLLPARFGPFRIRLLVTVALAQGAIGADALAGALKLLSCGCLLLAEPNQALSGGLGINRDALMRMGLNATFEILPEVATWARERAQARKPLPQLDPPAGVPSSALPEFQRVAFVVLAEAAQKPIRLTKEGLPYKTDARSVAGALLAPQTKKLRPSDPVPSLLYFVIAVLRGARLLVERHSELRPAAKAQQFFSAPAGQQLRVLLDGWSGSSFEDFRLIPTLVFGWSGAYSSEDVPWFKAESDLYGPSPTTVAIARRCITAAIADGVAAAPDGWYAIADIARRVFLQYPEMLFPRLDEYAYFVFRNVPPPQTHRAYTNVYRRRNGPMVTREELAARTLYMDTDWMEVEGAFIREVISRSLAWLGLTEAGPDAGVPDRFRLTALGQHLLCGLPLPESEPAAASKRAVVQPDYEVIVLDAARNLDLLAELDSFAERRALDRAATYRLTQAALARGLDRGWTGARVLKALESANLGPLPQNVRYSLDAWIRLYESLSVREAACLLEADDADQLDTWLADPNLAKLLGDRLGPTVVRVPRRRVEPVLKYCEGLGQPIWVVDYAEQPIGILTLSEPDLIELDAEQAEPYVRYRIEAFSEPAGQTGSTLLYRVTESSVRRAGRMGWRQPQIRDFLSLAANSSLPADLAVRICGWAGIVPTLRAEALVAVALPAQPVSWETLRHVAAIGSLIRALPAPELALIAPDDLEKLQRELATRGLRIQMDRLSAEQLKDRSTPELAGTVFGSSPLLIASALNTAFREFEDESDADPDDIQAFFRELGLTDGD